MFERLTPRKTPLYIMTSPTNFSDGSESARTAALKLPSLRTGQKKVGCCQGGLFLWVRYFGNMPAARHVRNDDCTPKQKNLGVSGGKESMSE